MKRLSNEIGNVYGRLTVLQFSHKARGGKAMWKCFCACGALVTVRSDNFRSGHIKSCGCYCIQYVPRIKTKSKLDQRGDRSLTYRSWRNMRIRCYNPNFNFYESYGGRGITVCDRWLENYANFLEDMGERPSKAYSIDRINVDGNYEPENCRWADKKVQISNRRTRVVQV